MKQIVLILTALTAMSANAADPGAPCANPKTQARRSAELQKIRAADQADREWQNHLAKGEQPGLKRLEHMSRADLKRRIRVGEIFGEGCLHSAADYEVAFLVYQHGNSPDQYFQAFLWAKKALDLGAPNVKGDVAMAIDRYLVSVGHKQLFGTQAHQATLGACFCVQPVEESFPQSLRDEYRGGRNAEYTGLAILSKINPPPVHCPVAYCDTRLASSPRGTVPGFW